MPILQTGTDIPTGFVQCEDGFVHRVEAVECVNPQATDDPLCAEFGGSCSTAADCTDKLHGSCQNNMFEGCTCNYGCTTDADCDAGQICACAGVIGEQATCVPAGCTLGGRLWRCLCGVSKYEGCCGDSYEIACASPDAECHTTADCSEDLCDEGWPEGGNVMHQCNYDGAAWTCNAPGWCSCDCGRPTLRHLVWSRVLGLGSALYEGFERAGLEGSRRWAWLWRRSEDSRRRPPPPPPVR